MSNETNGNDNGNDTVDTENGNDTVDTENWVSVVIKHYGTSFENDVFSNYMVSDRCNIKNTNTNRVLSDKGDRVGLSGGGIVKKLMRHRICIASFYPNEIPTNSEKYDVDHKDGIHNNMVLANLKWLTKSDHAIKTVSQTIDTRKSQVEKQGKQVMVSEVKNNGDIKWKHHIFNSCHCAARELSVRVTSISQSTRKGCWVNDMYKFEYVAEPLLDEEVFVSIGDYKVSNKGRIKMKSGKITVGANNTRTKYRTVLIKLGSDVKKRQYLIHRLVWMAHYGAIPDDLHVLHNDSYPTLDDTNYERNWLEDLRLGSQQDNSLEYHANRTDLKRVRCIETKTEYGNASIAATALGFKGSGSIHNVCKKKTKTAYGKTFEFC